MESTSNIEAKELLNKGAKAIRSDNNLMRSYVDLYKSVFSYEPNCAPCTFSNDFEKLRKRVLTESSTQSQKLTTMGNYKLKKRHQNEILTYKKDGRPFRSYGYTMTDDFAENFLKNATKEERKKREKMFEELPSKKAKKEDQKSADDSKKNEGENGKSEMKYNEEDFKDIRRAEVDEMLASNGLKPEDYSSIPKATKKLLTIKK